MTVKVPTYVTTAPAILHSAGAGHSGGEKTLEQGSFVKPIEPKYVPKHVLEKHKWFDPITDVFVYCHYGIVPIPKAIVLEVA